MDRERIERAACDIAVAVTGVVLVGGALAVALLAVGSALAWLGA